MMKHYKLFVWIVSLLALSILACQVGGLGGGTTISGSGNVVSQEYDLSDFDVVDISHAFNVNITQGESYSVIVRVDDNLMEHLEVVKQGNTLKIGLKPLQDYTVRNATMEAEVTMPELNGVEASGASDVIATGFESDRDFQVRLSGASSAVLIGSAGEVTVDASGSSDADLAEFPVGDARVDASGSSTVTVNVSGRLDVDASGSSDVFYLGSPTLGNVDTSGSSSVEPK
jgi:hypothetical protein